MIRAYLFLGVVQWVAAHDPLYLTATTACLSAIIVMQIANVFLCRDESQPVFHRGMFSNRLILAGIAIEVLLIAVIDCTPWGNRFFGTAPLPPSAWLFVVPFAIGMIAIEEVRKRFVRSRSLRAAGRCSLAPASAREPR